MAAESTNKAALGWLLDFAIEFLVWEVIRHTKSASSSAELEFFSQVTAAVKLGVLSRAGLQGLLPRRLAVFPYLSQQSDSKWPDRPQCVHCLRLLLRL